MSRVSVEGTSPLRTRIQRSTTPEREDLAAHLRSAFARPEQLVDQGFLRKGDLDSSKTEHASTSSWPAASIPSPRGSGHACESDGGDSDGQGTAQEGGGCGAPPYSARAAEKNQGFGGVLAVFNEILVCRTWEAISRRPREWHFHSDARSSQQRFQRIVLPCLLPHVYRKLG